MPAFNEEENIDEAVARACRMGEELASSWEVIVVDDGSEDRTARRVARQSLRDPRVRLLRHPANLGYGQSLRDGFHAAQGELIFYTDSDLQFDISDLRYFLVLSSQADLLVGFRVYRYDTVLRCLLSWIYNRLVSVLFRVRVRDVDCSFKLFRREVLEAIDLESTDFFIDTEMVAKARRWNFRILEKGVRHYPRPAGQSTVRPSDIPRTLRTLARMWARIYLPRWASGAQPAVPVCPPLRTARRGTRDLRRAG